MDTKELLEKRNRLMAEASTIAAKGELTNEDRAKFDMMIADAKVKDEDITRMQALENFNKEQNRSTRPPRAGFGNEDQTEETIKNQKRAFTQWMRTGQVSAEDRPYVRTQEQRDLGVGAISGRSPGEMCSCQPGSIPLSTLRLRATVSWLTRYIRSIRRVVGQSTWRLRTILRLV